MKEEFKKAEGESIPNAYKVTWFDRIPFWVRASLIKYWFFGMAYFFFVMGMTFLMGISDPGTLLFFQILILGVAMGFLNDFIIDNILEVMETNRHEAHYWWIFKSKKWWSVLINLPYGLLWSALSVLVCGLLGNAVDATGVSGLDWTFREPFSFALVAFAIDGVFVLAKDGILALGRRGLKEGNV